MRRLPAPLAFALAGVLAALLVRPDGSNVALHLGLVLAAGAMLLVGRAVERAFGAGSGNALQQILLGQAALVLWFCARPLLGFGVHRLELLIVAAVCGAWTLRRAPPAGEAATAAWPFWLCWWAMALFFSGQLSGELAPPSSDGDIHAFFLKLALDRGRTPLDQLPYSADAIHYPSGYAALCAVWSLLSGGAPVAGAVLQPALQGALAVGLVAEVSSSRRGKVSLPLAAAVLVIGAFVFHLPAPSPRLDGTPRLSCAALILLPLLLALRPQVSRALLLIGSAFSGIFAFALNPAAALGLLPSLLVSAPFLRGKRGPSWPGFAGSFAVVALVLWRDAYVRTVLQFGALAAGPVLPEPARQVLSLAAVIRGGFAEASASSLLWLLPARCAPGLFCPPQLEAIAGWLTPLLLVAAAVALLRTDRAPAIAVLACGAAIWLAGFLSGALDAGLSGRGGPSAMLRDYGTGSLRDATGPLLLLLLGLGLALAADLLQARLAQGLADLAAAGLAALVVVLCCGLDPELPLRAADDFSKAVLTRAHTLGRINADDISVAQAAGGVVPPGEKILLPGLPIQLTPSELWIFAESGARSVPLYGRSQFAFFLGLGGRGFDAASYRRHVCRALDLPWLEARGVRYLFSSATVERIACVRGWDQARARYFDEVLRTGQSALYRLKPGAAALAGRDPALGLPLASPLGPAGAALDGELVQPGPVGVGGWACARGFAGPVSIELSLEDGKGHRFSELQAAAGPVPPAYAALVRARCGPGPHAFAFAPVVAPPGRYTGRVLVRASAGEPLPLGAPFDLRVDF